MTLPTVSREEYQRAFRWAMLRLLDWEIGRPREVTPPDIVDIMERDVDLQVRGE